VQAGDVSLREKAKIVSKRLGLRDVETLGVEVATEIHPYRPLMWGCGARFRADRLRKPGWRPKEIDWRVLM
jgi:hypothetical protein